MSQLFDRMNEGGPLFMYPIFIVLLFIIALFIISLMGKRGKRTTSEIIGHLSLFVMMWGFLGSTLGLITAFDAIEGAGGVSQPMMAGGLKVALLCTLFGLFAFVMGRVCMLVLTIKAQQEEAPKV